MPEKNETGNPVFDYRAGFRSVAATVQNGLIFFGAALGVIAGALYVFASPQHPQRPVMGVAAVLGISLVCAGIGWGLYWPRPIRAKFRETYGPGK